MKNYSMIALCALLLGACTLVEVEDAPTDATAPVQENEPARETNNVTYTGVVQPAGISIYQQGSHRLVLPGGKFVLLESEALDLNGYVNEEVQIFGALRPTVEAGGMIMRVDRIELQQKEKEEEKEEKESEEEENIDEEVEVIDVEETPKEVIPEEPSEAFIENIELMSKQDYDPSHWTQQYCTSHVGFCVPVHRNFWYKSFGATGNALWHVEFSGAPVDSLRDGPIVLELVAGSAAALDGTIDESNGSLVAYKEWTFGRHFRISGDASLRGAVTYLVEHITEYSQ